jgi:hypothetical protein
LILINFDIEYCLFSNRKMLSLSHLILSKCLLFFHSTKRYFPYLMLNFFFTQNQSRVVIPRKYLKIMRFSSVWTAKNHLPTNFFNPKVDGIESARILQIFSTQKLMGLEIESTRISQISSTQKLVGLEIESARILQELQYW